MFPSIDRHHVLKSKTTKYHNKTKSHSYDFSLPPIDKNDPSDNVNDDTIEHTIATKENHNTTNVSDDVKQADYIGSNRPQSSENSDNGRPGDSGSTDENVNPAFHMYIPYNNGSVQYTDIYNYPTKKGRTRAASTGTAPPFQYLSMPMQIPMSTMTMWPNIGNIPTIAPVGYQGSFFTQQFSPQHRKHNRKRRKTSPEKMAKIRKKQELKEKEKLYVTLRNQISNAVKIQRWYRKHSTINKWKLFTRGYSIQQAFVVNELCTKLVDEILNQFITSIVLPQILIEIFSNKTYLDYDQHINKKDKQEEIKRRLIYSIYQDIELSVIKYDLFPDIARESINDFIQSWLYDQQKNTYNCHLSQKHNRIMFLNKESILSFMNDEIIFETTDKMLKKIIRQSIYELILKYLIDLQISNTYHLMLRKIVSEIVTNCINESIVNNIANDMINSIIIQEILPYQIIEPIVNQTEEKETIDKKSIELSLVQSKLESFLIDQALLQLMIEKLGTRDQKASIDKQIELWVNTQISKHLIHTHYSLHQLHQRVK